MRKLGKNDKFKIWKSPKDETRDHMNFLQHLAGNRELTVNPSAFQYKFDTSVEAKTDSLYIRRASGRVPFNASLLTAGQVKFSAHEMSARVRENMRKKMIEHDSLANAPKASLQVYDNVYGIFENKRAAHKAAEHFGRPKILSDHLKEIDRSTSKAVNYGYSTSLNGVQGKEHKINWNEFRGYVYGTKTLRDIKDPIIEDLIRRNRTEIKAASDTLNPTTTILSALKIASNFWVSTEKGDKGIACGLPGTTEATDTPKASPGTSTTEVIDATLGTSTNPVASQNPLSKEDAQKVENDIVEQVKADATTDTITESKLDPNRAVAGLSELSSTATFDDVVNDSVDTAEQIRNAKALAGRCDGEVNEKYPIQNFKSSLRIDAQLSDLPDTVGKTLGNIGKRVSKNAWKLSAFGDPNVFEKAPYTSADMIVLADCSSSMLTGGDNIDSKYTAAHHAAHISTAIKDRFPDAHMYGFIENDNRRGDGDGNAQLVPFGKEQFPRLRGSTPLCGAMKGLEKLHNLNQASILIITDGQPNICHNMNISFDADLCCRNRAKVWMSMGVRFATIYIRGYVSAELREEPLPVDLSIQIKRYDSVESHNIGQVFEFFGR